MPRTLEEMQAAEKAGLGRIYWFYEDHALSAEPKPIWVRQELVAEVFGPHQQSKATLPEIDPKLAKILEDEAAGLGHIRWYREDHALSAKAEPIWMPNHK